MTVSQISDTIYIMNNDIIYTHRTFEKDDLRFEEEIKNFLIVVE